MDREATFEGVKLQTEVAPKVSGVAELVWLYHGECIFASHKGALLMRVPKGTQARYKKPRGSILMVLGFISRKFGMVTIPKDEVPEFLFWINERHKNDANHKDCTLQDFPLSCKVYKSKSAHMEGPLCSFTMI